MTSEREVANALRSGLPVTVRWGWYHLETDVQPPSLPLVTIQRLTAEMDMDDMCPTDPARLVGTTMIETHAWHPEYEQARVLQDSVRAIVLPTGWRLRGEQDLYDPIFRAWRISAQWTNIGSLSAT